MKLNFLGVQLFCGFGTVAPEEWAPSIAMVTGCAIAAAIVYVALAYW